MDFGSERKRQRLATAIEPRQWGPPPLPRGLPGVPAAPVNWDFLSPWCNVLRGRLLMVDGYVRVLREKRSCSASDFAAREGEKDDKEDKQEVHARLEANCARTREALELLALVAHVDKAAWHMLLTERCELRVDEEESDEESGEEEEEIVVVRDGDEEFMLFSDEDDGDRDDESGSETSDGEREGERDRDDDERDEDEGDAATDVVGEIANSERRLECERDLLAPQFDFISIVSDYIQRERVVRPPLEEWQALFLVGPSGSRDQPSAAYRKAKEQILAMQVDGVRAHLQPNLALEIPVSLKLVLWPAGQEPVSDYLQELAGFIQTMQSQAQPVEDLLSTKADVLADCASMYVYRLRRLSLLLGGLKVTELFTTRLLAVLTTGIPIVDMELSLNTRSKRDDDMMPTREALAKLLSGIMVQFVDPGKDAPRSIASLRIHCGDAHAWQFKALCSALAVARTPIAKVCLSNVCEYRSKAAVRQANWRVLARALFRTRSCTGDRFSSVRGLKLPDVALAMEDLAEVAAVLKEKEHHETVAGSWEICRQRWMVRKGTLLQLLDREAEERNATVSESAKLAFDTYVQLMDEHPDENLDDGDSEWLDVIVPAYGECRVLREATIAVSTDEAEERGEPLRSLSLCCTTESDGLGGLLELVGWSLHCLSLTLHREIDANALVPTILSSCPLLTELELADCDIDLDSFAAAYEQIGDDSALAISSLAFQDIYGVGEGNGLLFAQQLGDPTSRLARHLKTLSILVDEDTEPLDDQLLNELRLALGKNHKLEKVALTVSRTRFGPYWKRRFRRFHGQELLPRPLADNLKLAFLSVARGSGGEDGSSRQSAVRRLDRPILSLIFEFAATRVIRSVKVHC
ncbi:hypothetical protein BBJ28_00020552 [Nothophytophthora sp. Chile5]|nr:hypothetical protein BBJ28_00020552 [Nothophytophthora sp. Chile5]